MIIRLGLPRSIMNELAHEAASLGAPILVSMGSLFDPKKDDFHRIGMAPWFMDTALDSAGFSAMLRGGYRWSVYDHVDLVATNSSRSGAMMKTQVRAIFLSRGTGGRQWTTAVSRRLLPTGLRLSVVWP